MEAEYVYAVLEAEEDGDGYLDYNLLTVGKNIDVCRSYIAKYIEDRAGMTTKIVTGVHPSMNASNQWIYVGTRKECMVFSGDCDRVGGFVIEKFLLLV